MADDELNLASKPRVLRNMGDGSESVIWSGLVVKINRHGSQQSRVFCVTNVALYNMKPGSFAVKRRIEIDSLSGLTASQITDAFVIHVPSEYDYHVISVRKVSFWDCLQLAFTRMTGKEFNLRRVPLDDLTSVCVTKVKAKKDPEYRRSRSMRDMAKLGGGGGGGGGGGDSGGGSGGGSGAVGARMPPPASFEDFTVLKQIGDGVTGAVYLARHEDSGRTGALKLLSKERVEALGSLGSAASDLLMMHSLSHPFLASVRYFWMTEQLVCIFSDLGGGADLLTHLSRSGGGISERAAAFYVAQVACALSHLHSKRIYMRCVKPEGIVLDGRGNALLTDFGQAFACKPDLLAYVSPEIARAIDDEDTEAAAAAGSAVGDWWSLGVLMVELLSGRPPWRDEESEGGLLAAITSDKVKLPPGLSFDACSVILGLLTRDAATRWGFRQLSEAPLFATHGISFRELLNGELSPPFEPPLSDSADCRHFSDEQTAVALDKNEFNDRMPFHHDLPAQRQTVASDAVRLRYDQETGCVF
eukprot:PLAT286.2.p1 GENE.PLAT286.2~~PLAT286.2.p1  ORF type:complete len:530 (+),score=205.13 PLAT286.2:1-1590(+)